ncbi:hypothetical protein ASPWEDRAFT_170832 [Aspergillus wentii DTO 134E9]|uniref:Rho-GAP domain-containing protein n=1 Tax=Aspergillus wentii DTO 134E9 TaxID=1073089 RepID=A0A1L9RQV8_ASPWE|nr:uncharacterized protein ASPWEDRAFT_170832 [Aspergillus wentii DTO 134E9]OJJ37346.1 hypothetical protein ASPWEDRAFT_170832 [Aspergillus wentii DTO 134E9]
MGLFSVFSRSTQNGDTNKPSGIRRSWALVGPGGSDEIAINHTTDSSETALEGKDSADTNDTSENAVAAKTKSTLPKKNDKGPKEPAPPTDPKSTDDGTLEPRSSATDSKHSVRGTRRLAGFMTLLRSRKAQRQKIPSEMLNKAGQVEACDNVAEDRQNNPTTECTVQEANRLQANTNGNAETRKVSDQTVDSHKSHCTEVTVHRHPSKRTLTPITMVNREDLYQNPFDEAQETSPSGSGSNPFTDPTRTTTRSSFEYSDNSSQLIYQADVIERPQNPIPQHECFRTRSSSSKSSHSRKFSNGSTWSCHDQYDAAVEFNLLATKLHLNPLDLSHKNKYKDDGRPANETHINVYDRLPRRRDRIYCRIRTMRSSLQLKPPLVPGERSVRRVRTHANLSSRSYPMTSLRGKSLETLARLGGHSYLSLSTEFAPARLKLPVCFVATAVYLRRHASGVRNVFFDPGDLKAAIRMYDHFAHQVLTAERENEKIEVTMRRGTMPLDLAGMLDADIPGKSPPRALSVAWVFKSLLAGLPGGILGSTQLYHVLLNIYYGRVSEYELERVDSYLEGISAPDNDRSKAIALAILALTSEFQLELICAVFGLCASLLHETDRMVMAEQYCVRNGMPSSFGMGLMNIEELSWVFGTLLMGTGQEDRRDTFGVIKREIESQRVAYMVMDHWRSISRQFRRWGRYGYPGQRAIFRSWCGGSRRTSEARSDEPGDEEKK